MTATDVAVALGRMSMPGCHLPSGGNHESWCISQLYSALLISHGHPASAPAYLEQPLCLSSHFAVSQTWPGSC